jgi:hypothetical protein
VLRVWWRACDRAAPLLWCQVQLQGAACACGIGVCSGSVQQGAAPAGSVRHVVRQQGCRRGSFCQQQAYRGVCLWVCSSGVWLSACCVCATTCLCILLVLLQRASRMCLWPFFVWQCEAKSSLHVSFLHVLLCVKANVS